jgi:hypothetical protein
MATGVRVTSVFSCLEEHTAWLTEEADFESVKQKIPTWNVSTNLQNAPIENQASRAADLGKHEAGIGLPFDESSIGFSTYCYGYGSALGNGDSPVIDTCVMAQLMGACLGGAPTGVDGTTVKAATSPTTTSVAETAAGNNFAGSFIAWKSGASTYLRPIGTYAIDTMTLLMALPSAPAPADVLNGLVSVIMTEDAMAHVLQGDVLKRNTTDAAKAGQMYEYFGAVGNFTLPEVGVAEAQTIDFELKVGRFTRYNQKARTAPASTRPTVTAGGEFLLARFGTTATTALRFLNVSVSPGRSYIPDPNANSAYGINGWVLGDQDTVVTVTVHDDQAVPSGFTATNFPALFASGGAENRFHLLLSYGNKVAGKIFALYFPALQLEREPEDIDMGGLTAWKLTFSLVSGNGEDQIWCAIA